MNQSQQDNTGKKSDTTVERIPLRQYIFEECEAMVRYALSAGLKIPTQIIEILETFEQQTAPQNKPGITELNSVHNQLAKIVEPAKPRSILMQEKEKKRKRFLPFLGSVPFIRRMMLASLFCMIAFILISLSPDVNDDPSSWNLFESSGLTLLLRELFLLSAAGLGASFAALFTANRYIVRCNFDSKYESSYWTRFILGIIAGMLLATLIPIEKNMDADFGKPLLAMLGGFAAHIVYQILARLIETIGSLVQGSTASRTEAKVNQAKARATEDDMKNRFKMASDLMKVRDMVDSGLPADELKKNIALIMDRLTESGPMDTQDKDKQ